MPTPEEQARQKIDQLLTEVGWQVQDRKALNLGAARGVAMREVPFQTGFADCMLSVDRKAEGVIGAKAEGVTHSGVSDQPAAYLTGLPPNILHVQLPRPFAYESTGVETYFQDERDPEPHSRRVLAFHRPETLAEWAAESTEAGCDDRGAACCAPTLRGWPGEMPPLITEELWDAQIEAIQNLERSFAEDRSRALDQMATSSANGAVRLWDPLAPDPPRPAPRPQGPWGQNHRHCLRPRRALAGHRQ